MQLGNFSISLSVKDIGASRVFCETLGFSVFAGDERQGWLIMKSGAANIGLFHGILEKNTLTFNPGWDQDGRELKAFADIRDIQKKLKQAGIQFQQEAREGTGPSSFLISDPDGNSILVDQHVPRAH